MTSRFVLVLLVLVLCLSAMAWSGFAGLASSRRSLDTLYDQNVLKARIASDLVAHLDDAEQTVLQYLLADSGSTRRSLAEELDSVLSPQIEVGIANLRRLKSSYPGEETTTEVIAQEWSDFRRAWATAGRAGVSGTGAGIPGQHLSHLLNIVTTDADQLEHLEGTEARVLHDKALQTSSARVRDMEIILVLGLLAGVGVVLWLIRSILPRTLSYSRFAERIAEGDFSHRLQANGTDELAKLGLTLDDVARRQQADDAFDRTQLEFTDTLQLTADEREAYELLQRHLERSIKDSRVSVLNRNNSADRLESSTPLPEDSPLEESLKGAVPRACLAVRMAQPQVQSAGADALVSCEVCTACPGTTTCTPLLVSGEVIGSVLVNHPEPLALQEQRRVRESVRLAAPVIANLRNLAVAQLRAATDALTGLPNRRAMEDTLKRMVAQAGRTGTPLAALMLDLDHFKRVNDEFGHGRGDEFLAAVGAVLREFPRQGDFAARYGGEEFLLLLPATAEEGARVLGEKIRAAIAEITVPSLEVGPTASIGIAVLPDHALDAETLVRSADRALYVAKTRGRDRIEVAVAMIDQPMDLPVAIGSI